MTPVNFHEIKNSDAEIINVMFTDDVCNKNTVFNLISYDISNAISVRENDFNILLVLHNELLFSAEKKLSDYTSSLLDCILYKLELSQKHVNSVRLNNIQKALIFIQKNFRFGITLSDTAAFAGLSVPYLSSLLRKETGMTFKQHINALRFDYAKKLLKYSELNITQVCYESGFEDYANFLRHFKQRFDITPGEYKKTHRDL